MSTGAGKANTKYFVVVTVSTRHPSGLVEQATITFLPEVPAGATREGIFQWALQRVPEHLRGATVLFFSAEPNAVEKGEAS